MRRRTFLSLLAAVSVGTVGGCVSFNVAPSVERNPFSDVSKTETADTLEWQAEIELRKNRYATKEIDLKRRSVVSHDGNLDGKLEVFAFEGFDSPKFQSYKDGDEFANLGVLYDRGSSLSAQATLDSGTYVVVWDNNSAGQVGPDGTVSGDVSLSYEPT